MGRIKPDHHHAKRVAPILIRQLSLNKLDQMAQIGQTRRLVFERTSSDAFGILSL